MSDDVLSDVLHAVRLSGALFFWVEATAPWAAIAPSSGEIVGTVLRGADHVMAFHVIVEGECWACFADGPPERVVAGDVIVFPQGDAHVLRSERGFVAPPPALPLADDTFPLVRRYGPDGPPAARLVCGFLGCDARPFNPLIEALPPMLHVPSGGGPLADLVRLAASETETPRAGGEALRARLAEMLFVEAVRGYLSRLPDGAGGWLGGLRDAHVGRALALLHARPAHPWTLDELARGVGLSRTPLHERFGALVGQPPIQYLTRWRMQLAASLLARGNDKVASVALQVGYESEAAFNRAFKRLVGVPPAAWRRQSAGAEAALV